MKKNITINLAGQLFAIDEDAYALLLNYTETLRRYYRRQPEGEEVVDDIEARIAELFGELLTQGYNAITIEHVQNIIQRIGRIEDITDGGDSTEHGAHAEGGNSDHLGAAGAAQAMGEGVRGAWNKVRSGKRFYRDTENKMLGGVLAGCSKYFGGDVVIWRIVFLILMILPLPFVGECTGTVVILYIIMAIIAPAASTPEERLKMRGEKVNPQNLAEEVSRESTNSTSNAARAQRRQTINIICAILLFLVSAWMWIGFLGVVCGGGVLGFMPDFIAHQMYDGEIIVQGFDADKVVYSILYILLAVAVCLFVLAYTTLHTGLSILGKVKAMSLKERLVWLFIWVLSVVGIVMASVNCAATVQTVEAKYSNDERVEIEATPAPADSVVVDSAATSVAPDSVAAKSTETSAAPDTATIAQYPHAAKKSTRASKKHRRTYKR
ncbi:MAG: PspC domain-containing protein [Bacteroidales bacterium]|nr:PspC domain-containing protein [Bacteroidales bacterium]